MKTHRYKQHGLSMIEVLVALAIFASTVVLALGSLQFQLERQYKIEHKHLAGHLSNNLASELQLQYRRWPIGPEQAKYQYAGKTWTVNYSPKTGQLLNWNSLTLEIYLDNTLLATQTVHQKFSADTQLADNAYQQIGYRHHKYGSDKP
ncbi:prepilin-type N-terminal cleavage/methylation domain-containing protein [uncultured Pseudoteredinibacter sp.]|uniref:prepilin-type N-terminal cleavage/methylation domain-containing protein n=1 Tax=uncultured Pseudoteredinibacter sp. TaxID=1641701 RepID=UPI0026053917|nr:prepilin-type N-terminal cleavage/methylation domain-containing protein [uncultured Pseudoteredinibacter sp.]